MARGPAEAAGELNVPVGDLQRALGLRVVYKLSRGHCFPLAIADATVGRVPAGTVRPQACQYINANPGVPVVAALTPQERRSIHRDREYISDNQARVIAVALRLDIFIFDGPHHRVRFVEYGQGVVSYPEHDACADMLLGRQGDEELNLYCMILYTPGHYRALKW